jgi:preprotein translocase subunit SecB
VYFEGMFFDEAPVVFAQVATESVKIPLLTRIKNVSPDMFEVKMESEASYTGTLEVEEILWVAWNQGETLNSLAGVTTLQSD